MLIELYGFKGFRVVFGEWKLRFYGRLKVSQLGGSRLGKHKWSTAFVFHNFLKSYHYYYKCIIGTLCAASVLMKYSRDFIWKINIILQKIVIKECFVGLYHVYYICDIDAVTSSKQIEQTYYDVWKLENKISQRTYKLGWCIVNGDRTIF